MHKKTDKRQHSDSTSAPSPRLGYALWQTQHAVERVHDRALEAVGITLTQAAALLHLNVQPGLSGAELARRLLVTPQSTATLLAQLEKKGWIQRAPHEVHRTLIEVTITGEGGDVLQRAIATMDATDKRIAEGLSVEEVEQLNQSLALCLSKAQSILA